MGEITSDYESQSGSAEASQSVAHGVGELATKRNDNLKKKRAQFRLPNPLIKKFIDQGAEMRKRIEKEIVQIRKDFKLAHECHAEMYEYIEESQTKAMDNWEDTNDLYDIEEIAEDFLQSLSVPHHANAKSLTNEQIHEQSNSNNDR